MNVETGKVYSGPDILKAEERGEKLVPISPRTAKFIREAREAKAAALKQKRRVRDRQAKASRRRNR